MDLLKALQVMNIEYDMADLTKINAAQLGKYKQVWAFSTDEMNAKDQQVIVDYLLTGGNLVMFPAIPGREMNQRTCTIIQDAVGIKPFGDEVIDSPLVDIFNLRDIKCANPQLVYSEESLAGAEVIARTIKGSACGFRKNVGQGTFIHLGTWIGFDTEGHKPVYLALLKTSGAKLRQAETKNEFLTVRQRFTDNNQALLFVGNYYNEEHSGKLSYIHPESGEQIQLPYLAEAIAWPALHAMLTPVCMPIAEGLKMLHTTSDLLSVTVKTNKVELAIYGDRDLPGELVMEGKRLDRIKSATINNEHLIMQMSNGRLVLSYLHVHRKEMILTLEMD
jgi:beta-galactosidase